MNDSDILYVLSRDFAYESVICPDVGPPIAADYGWRSATLSSEALASPGPIVIDNRMLPHEVEWLRTALPRRLGTTFLRIVDDFGPELLSYRSGAREVWYTTLGACHGWNRFVHEMLENPAVGVLHTYDPGTYVRAMMQGYAPHRFVHAPYVYQPEHELPIATTHRRNRILFSGAVNATVYPERRRFLAHARHPSLLGLFVDILPHPGYPDLGRPLQHTAIGSAYLDRLASYRYAFVSPSHTGFELLKYREFAYAGVCPVGHLPPSLADCPPEAFVTFDGHTARFLYRTILANDHMRRAMAFRAYMRSKRDRDHLRTQVTHALCAFSR